MKIAALDNITSRLPRSFKDRMPRAVLHRYHALRQRWRRAEQGQVESIAKLIDSLNTVSMDAYLQACAKDLGEYAEAPNLMTSIEINDSCNLNCIICETSEAQRKKGLMDLGLFEDIVARMVARGARTTNLHTIGDPTANKNLAKYLEVLRRHKVSVEHLSSNCQMLDRHMDTIFDYSDVIGALRPSIDAASREVYERIRRGAAWETLHRNLIAFAERNAKQKSPIPVFVNNVIIKDNFPEIGLIPATFSYVCAETNHAFGTMTGIGPTVEFFKSNCYFDEYTHNSPCKVNWGNSIVHKDGSLSTCCSDYDGDLIFGHINRDDLDSVYNNDRMQAIRRAHRDRDIPAMPKLCRECYIVDPRFGPLLNGVIQYFYHHVKRHPMILQDALNKIGPMLKAKQYNDVMSVISSL